MENTKLSPSEIVRGWLLRASLLAALILLAGGTFGFQSARFTGETATLEAIGAGDIFRNNAGMLLTNLLGVLLLGLPNLVSGAMNGYALGSAAAISLRQYGGLWLVRAFLPHAVLELPVIVVSVAVGFLPWLWIARRIRHHGEPRHALLGAVAKALLAVAGVCLLVLLAAAWIEARVSMRVAT